MIKWFKMLMPFLIIDILVMKKIKRRRVRMVKIFSLGDFDYWVFVDCGFFIYLDVVCLAFVDSKSHPYFPYY